MKTITINVPDDCDIQIVRKKEEKKEPIIRTYQDLIDNGIKIKGYYIAAAGISSSNYVEANKGLSDIAASKKVVKSMLAMAMISQLMPYYGGMITDEEWKNDKMNKYCIDVYEGEINKRIYDIAYCFLAFHTAEQRDDFLKYNERLVKDYLMLD